MVVLIIVSYVMFLKTSEDNNKNKKSFIIVIHTSMLLLLLVVIYQIFLFKELDIISIYKIVNLKVSMFFNLFSVTTSYNFIGDNHYQTVFSKGNIDIFHHILGGDISLLLGIFKNIFEKNVLMSFFFLDELYNYNLQTLIQINPPIFLFFK